ncbi:MAG: DUF58 domain-containing protein [Bacteroidetes bacterium]|nr:DUF58 domain-containing protein [Bacteroidota bacterium]MBK9424786.1 DUF58 domain-containing protein [Bacteroidota bacterium]
MAINQHEIQQLGHLELIARQVVEGFITGLHKSPFHGFSVEFAEHRLYNTGESTRHMDWKLYGKTDKLFVKRYEEETNLRCQIIIDNSSSMHFPGKELQEKDTMNKITFSSHAAAAIIHLLKMQRDAAGLSIFSETLEENTPARSSTLHQKLLFMKLEDAMNSGGTEVRRKTSAALALHQIAETIHKRSLVIIFSDMMDSLSDSNELFNALQHLKYNKHEVILFHVTDKKLEQDFKFENRPYQFIDVETGETVKVHSNQVRETYLSQMSKFQQELKLKCAQYKIDLIDADIHEGYRQVLMPYLIKRQRMQ